MTEGSKLGLMTPINDHILSRLQNNPKFLPNLRSAPILFVGSDYTGQARHQRYDTLSFIIADPTTCTHWQRVRKQLQETLLSKGRHITYKGLNDKYKLQALPDFLNAANGISGIIATILTDPEALQIFRRGSKTLQGMKPFSELTCWKSKVFDKAFRVMNFASLFVAGLSCPDQRILWCTDTDDIAQNESQEENLEKLSRYICRKFAPHRLQFEVKTKAADPGSGEIVDLIAIPDLVAGAVCQAFTQHYEDNFKPTEGNLDSPPIRNLAEKDTIILSWFSENDHPLRRLIFRIDPGEKEAELSIEPVEIIK